MHYFVILFLIKHFWYWVRCDIKVYSVWQGEIVIDIAILHHFNTTTWSTLKHILVFLIILHVSQTSRVVFGCCQWERKWTFIRERSIDRIYFWKLPNFISSACIEIYHFAILKATENSNTSSKGFRVLNVIRVIIVNAHARCYDVLWLSWFPGC